MKGLFILFVLLFSFPCYSQWYYQNNAEKYETYTESFFFDTLNGWIGNKAGTIIRTTNGGDIWYKQGTGTYNDIRCINFYSLNSGWAVGPGIILHTTDGGNNWMNKSRSITGNYFVVSAVNDSSCFVTGDSGMVIYTSNHGSDWEERNYYFLYNILGAKFFSSTRGFIAGDRTIAETTNGGLLWTNRYNGMSTISDLCFAGEKFGWTTGFGSGSFMTSDSGTHWNPIGYFNDRLMTDISFADSLHGMAIEMHLSYVHRTTNGGMSWIISYFIYPPDRINALSYVNSKIGWLIGENGLIAKTTNGGINWVPQYNRAVTGSDLGSVFFLDRANGWAAGYWGVFLKTTNGGITWKTFPMSIYNKFKNIFFISKTTGWGACLKKIIKTTDGGEHWIDMLQGTGSFNSIHFVDSLKGWAIDERSVYNTTDGGATWESKLIDSISHLNAVHFADNLRGFIAAKSGKVYRTFDGGETWELLTFGDTVSYNSIDFSTPFYGMIVGDDGYCLRTSTGGTVWLKSRAGLNNLISVSMVDSLNCWAAPYQGDIWRTTDFGVNWIPTWTSSIGTNKFTSISVVDNSAGWVVGTGGIILSYGYVTEAEEDINPSLDYSLYQNYPNPFNHQTKIRYDVPVEGMVSIKVYDILGNEIMTLVNELRPAGSAEIDFNASDLPSGIYFYRMITGNKVSIRKALLLK